MIINLGIIPLKTRGCTLLTANVLHKLKLQSFIDKVIASVVWLKLNYRVCLKALKWLGILGIEKWLQKLILSLESNCSVFIQTLTIPCLALSKTAKGWLLINGSVALLTLLEKAIGWLITLLGWAMTWKLVYVFLMILRWFLEEFWKLMLWVLPLLGVLLIPCFSFRFCSRFVSSLVTIYI